MTALELAGSPFQRRIRREAEERAGDSGLRQLISP